MRLYLIRHGETDMNVRGCYYGNTEANLTEKGRSQAMAFQKLFKDIPFDRIIVSPLMRTWDTALLALGSKEDQILSFQREPRLKEQNFGIFEGKTYQELMEEYPEEMDQWNHDFSHYRIPGGESFADVRVRVEEWVKQLPKGKGNMLIVAHKGTLGHMLAALLGLPLEGFWNFVFEQGCYSCVDLEDGYAIIRSLNRTVV